MSLPFRVSGRRGRRVVRIEHRVFDDADLGRLILRTSADRAVRLVPEEWPQHLADNVDRRLKARDGQGKGRVLVIWGDVGGQPATPLAVCCWHVHEGNWPLAIFDGSAANMVDPELAGVLRDILVAAVAELAGHSGFADRQVPRPTDRVLWRVDHPAPGPNLATRKARAIAAASRGQADFGAKKIPKKDRPKWAKEGFLGRIDVDSS